MSSSLLYGHMRESECNEIKLEDTPWQAFQVLLEYMYTGQVDKLDFQVRGWVLAGDKLYYIGCWT